MLQRICQFIRSSHESATRKRLRARLAKERRQRDSQRQQYERQREAWDQEQKEWLARERELESTIKIQELEITRLAEINSRDQQRIAAETAHFVRLKEDAEHGKITRCATCGRPFYT